MHLCKLITDSMVKRITFQSFSLRKPEVRTFFEEMEEVLAYVGKRTSDYLCPPGSHLVHGSFGPFVTVDHRFNWFRSARAVVLNILILTVGLGQLTLLQYIKNKIHYTSFTILIPITSHWI